MSGFLGPPFWPKKISGLHERTPKPLAAKTNEIPDAAALVLLCYWMRSSFLQLVPSGWTAFLGLLLELCQRGLAAAPLVVMAAK